MARLDMEKFSKSERLRNTIHERVYAEYVVFEQNGEKYVQIDTFGRSDREIPGKVSQTIQLDKESARFLVELLLREYNFSLQINVD